MSKDILLVAAVGAAVVIVLQKQNQARAALTASQRPAAGQIPASGVATSVNGDMWTRLLGSGFTSLVGGLGKSTSDGKPVGSGDPVADYIAGGWGDLVPSNGSDLLPSGLDLDSASSLMEWV